MEGVIPEANHSPTGAIALPDDLPRNATAAETRAYIQDLQARLEMANGRIDSFHTKLVLADDENGRIREQLFDKSQSAHRSRAVTTSSRVLTHQESRILLKVQKNADRMFEVHPEILKSGSEMTKRIEARQKEAQQANLEAEKEAQKRRKEEEKSRPQRESNRPQRMQGTRRKLQSERERNLIKGWTSTRRWRRR